MIRRDTIFEFSAYFQLLSSCISYEVLDFVHVTFFLPLVVANLAQKILFYQDLLQMVRIMSVTSCETRNPLIVKVS